MAGRGRPGWVVLAAAASAAGLRFPGLFFPLGPDESGLTLAARAWDPQPGSVYGDYFVDRPPQLMALVKLSDLVGGASFLRLVAALGCAALVLAAAATARTALRYAGVADDHLIDRTGAWTAVLTAAFTSSALIDPVMAKAELLGIPFVVTSFWLTLRATTRLRADATAVVLAGLAGLSAGLALGMKQNLYAGVVFGTAVLVGSRLTGRTSRRGLLRLGAGATVGALLPVTATVAWAVAAGVRLETLAYTVYGFRAEAIAVIAGGSLDAPTARAQLLAGIVVATGMVFVPAGVVLHRRRIDRVDRTLLVATVLVVVADVAALVLGGTYWRPYLFALIPGAVLGIALLLAARGRVARQARVLVAAAAVCSVTSSILWAPVAYVVGVGEPVEVYSGRAIAGAAAPGDTLVVYGGRADLVLASGLEAPYRHLWSLPMRVLDPDLAELRALLAGPRAPTWVVMGAPGWAWDHNGAPIRAVLDERYDVHGRACNGRYVYLRTDVTRPPLDPACAPK